MKFLQRIKFDSVISSHKIVFVFGVLFALLLLQFGIFYHYFEELTEANKRTEDNYRIIVTTDNVVKDLLNMQSGARGYLLTGYARFLDQFKLGEVGFVDFSEKADELSRNYQALRNRLGFLRQQYQRWRQEIDAQIELRRNARGRPALMKAVLHRVKSGIAKRRFDAMTATMATIKKAEYRQLVNQNHAAARLLGNTKYLLIFSSLFAVLLVASLYTLLGHSLRRMESANRLLRESNTYIRAVFDTVAEGIITTDEQCNVKTANQAIIEIFGYELGELIGQRVDLLVANSPGDESQVHILRAALQNGEREQRDIEVEGRAKDGTVFPVKVQAREMLDAGSRRFVKVIQDVSEHKKIERMKNQVISMVSHELRTPLTSICGSLGLIAGGMTGALNPQAKQLVDIAYKNSQRLARLIDDILDIEKVEAGMIDFNIKPVEVMPLIEQALQSNLGFAQALDIEFVVGEKLPGAYVLADSDRLIQVLTNLLSNAVKYSPKGEVVTVNVKRIREGMIRVSVVDRGPGITPEFHERLFDRFTQDDSLDAKNKGGTGLGLNISKAIIENMNGQIGFDREQVHGATFFFDLPACIDALPRQPDHGRRFRVLVGESNADAATLITQMLTESRYDVDIAHDTRSLTALLAQCRYDAIIVDIMLPGRNNVSFISDLYTSEQTRRLPIVVISATVDTQQRVLNGVVLPLPTWLGKNIDQAALLAAVADSGMRSGTERPRVLHVEADVNVVQMVSTILQASADVVTAGSVKTALKALEAQVFDLLILEIDLPDGSGLQLLPLLGSKLPPVPVVIFSSHEITAETVRKAAACLIKAETSKEHLLETILSLVKVGKRDNARRLVL